MDKFLAVARREYTERVRSKWFLFATFFGPLVMALMLFLPAWLAGRSKPSDDVTDIVIIDASGANLGARVAERMPPGGPGPDIRVVLPAELTAAESTATRDVLSKRHVGYLLIDGLTLSGERARYAGRNATTIPDMRVVEGAVTQAVLGKRFEAAGLDAERVRALSKLELNFKTERLSDRGRGDAGENAVGLAYAVAMLLYMSIVLYGQSILMGVIEEKSQRVAEVVVASVSPDKLLAGKVVGVGAVGMTQQIVWVGSALLLMRFKEPIGSALGLSSAAGPSLGIPDVSMGTALAFLCFFVLGYTFFSSMFAAAGSMVSSTQDAQQVATPLTLLIIPSVLLLAPVLLEPNGTLARVVTLIPFTAPILMPVRMSLTSVPMVEVLGSIALLVLACFGAIWLAARIYRVGVLMYGKKPSLAEVIRWVRLAR